MAQRICDQGECAAAHYARGLCRRHYDQARASGLEPLTVKTVVRAYSVNEAYFDRIDTPEKAYWLGFIAGDGYVSDRGYLSVALALRDEAHLAKLALVLETGAPLRRSMNPMRGKRYPRVRLVVHSRRMATALVRHGVMPRKSLILQPWAGPPSLMPHYWRGLVDADGTIGVYASNCQVSLVGSHDTVEAFRAWTRTVAPQLRALSRPQGRIWLYRVSGRVASRSVAIALYEDASVALDRKAERARKLIATGPPVVGTPEYRAMLSARQLGRKMPYMDHRAHRTPEYREAARQRALGRRPSAETRARRSESMRRAHATRSVEQRAEIAAKISAARHEGR